MASIWFVFIIELLLLSIIKQLEINLLITSISLIFIHVVITIAILYRKYTEIYLLLLAGLAVRLGLVFLDLFGRHILTLPNSGMDSEGFYASAVLISNNIDLLFAEVYGGVYSKLNGLLFYIIGTERIMAHYFNLLLGISIIIITYKTLKRVSDNIDQIYLLTAVITFFPQSIIFSAIFMRENIVTFFVALSVNRFVKWYFKGVRLDFIKANSYIFIGSLFHGGIIGIIAGYFILYIFYDREKRKIDISLSSMIILTTFILLSLLIFSQYGGVFNKIDQIDSIESLYTLSNKGRGGSVYLQRLEVNSLTTFILYSPLKMIYFLISPVPHMWRGIRDIITFVFSSLVFLISIILAITNKDKIKKNPLLIGLFISLVVTALFFGTGVSNAGTAMRHRQKILPLLIIYLSMISNKEYDSIHYK